MCLSDLLRSPSKSFPSLCPIGPSSQLISAFRGMPVSPFRCVSCMPWNACLTCQLPVMHALECLSHLSAACHACPGMPVSPVSCLSCMPWNACRSCQLLLQHSMSAWPASQLHLLYSLEYLSCQSVASAGLPPVAAPLGQGCLFLLELNACLPASQLPVPLCPDGLSLTPNVPVVPLPGRGRACQPCLKYWRWAGCSAVCMPQVIMPWERDVRT